MALKNHENILFFQLAINYTKLKQDKNANNRFIYLKYIFIL